MHDFISGVYELVEAGLFEEAILQMVSKKDKTEEWCTDGDGVKNAGRWSSFPPRIREVVRQIESQPEEFKYEQQLLDQLVNPAVIRDNWSTIAIDSEVRHSVTKLVQQQLDKGEASYGILRDHRIGGAMLYGPPGTGKTHLARIIARELGVIMIAITAADMNSMWIGETEKAIKALFNLGRMINPSMIFVDEADAMLRGRKSQDHAHHRISMNQLLQEMDGLHKSMTAPFFLISTNFPRDLDHAVLRSVPRRVYIGLPSREQRAKIFQICLKDEAVADDIGMDQLAKLSSGFSGSDITTICVQAALCCYTTGGGKRVLQRKHFRKAFQQCTTSVSKMSLAAIQGFAKEFDPQTYDRLVENGQEGPPPIDTITEVLGHEEDDDCDNDNDGDGDGEEIAEDDAEYRRALRISKSEMSEAKEEEDYRRALVLSLADLRADVKGAVGSQPGDDDDEEPPPYSSCPDDRDPDLERVLKASKAEAEANAARSQDNDADDENLAMAIKLSLEAQSKRKESCRVLAEASSSARTSRMESNQAFGDRMSLEPKDLYRDVGLHGASNDGTFCYTPLHARLKEIRLLAIAPSASTTVGQGPSIPQCTLRTVQLDDLNDDYKAVSATASSLHLPTNASFRLLLWRHLSSRLAHGFARSNMAELERQVRQVSGRMSQEDDIQVVSGIPIRHRFNWGDYITLSYVWGDPKAAKKTILLHGCPFQVTPNLYQALLDLRDSDELQKRQLLVWIDGLCINQNDLAERAAQVQRMAEIYSTSQMVRAHVGSPTPSVAREIPTIRAFLDSTDGIPINEIKWTTIEQADALNAILPVTIGLASCPFWERLWILQELALAPIVLFYYGEYSFTTREVYNLCQLLPRGWVAGYFRGHSAQWLEEKFEISDRARMRMVTLRPHSETGIEHAPLGIVDLVCLSQSTNVTDPRDKIYGLHALLPEPIQQMVKPNYSPLLSPWHLLIDFSRVCIEWEGDLSFMSRIRKPPTSAQHLPSWTVDLFTAGDVTGFTTPSNKRTHRANKGFEQSKPVFSTDGSIMTCEGVFVDSIAELGAFRRFKNWSDAEEEALLTPEVGSVKPLDPATTDWRRTLARVLIQDADFEFSDMPNIFDILWIQQVSFGHTLGLGAGFYERDNDSEKDVPVIAPEDDGEFEDEGHFEEDRFADWDKYWPRFYKASTLQSLFISTLFGNDDFGVGGDRLRSYFLADSIPLGEPDFLIDLAVQMAEGINNKRLCRTAKGLLGSIPEYAKLQDRVAILSNCDMPVLLRPRGPHFRLVGFCFIEGLMTGEVAGLNNGKCTLESISIC